MMIENDEECAHRITASIMNDDDVRDYFHKLLGFEDDWTLLQLEDDEYAQNLYYGNLSLLYYKATAQAMSTWFHYNVKESDEIQSADGA